MRTGRFFVQFCILLLFGLGPASQAFAGWGLDDDSTGAKSGLDLEQGYDLNTVTTMTGRVSAIWTEGDKGHAIVDIRTGTGTVRLVLGPKWFWSEQGFGIKLNDEISARGSKAQGKDGNTYLIVERISNHSTGKEVILRNDSGKPAWSGASRSANRPANSNRPQSPGRHGGGRRGR